MWPEPNPLRAKDPEAVGTRALSLMKNLAVRVAVAVVAIPAILFVCWRGGLWLFGFVLAISTFGLYEYVRLIAPRYNLQRGWTFLLFSVGIPLVVHWYGEAALAPAVLATFAVLSLALVGTGQPVNAVLGLGVAFLGIIYVPLLSSFLLLVRSLPAVTTVAVTAGGRWLILLFVAIWSCDTAAYFVGRRFGKHKLAPVISPNKTIEGAIGGLLGGMLAAYLCQGTFFREALLKDALVVGVIIGVFGQLGDLVESMLKRDAQVKDSSAIIPGHGGVLDRFDSLLFTLPFVYYYLRFFVYR